MIVAKTEGPVYLNRTVATWGGSFVIVLFLIAPNVVWVFCDHTPFAWDQSHYALGCLNLWNEFLHNVRHWPQAVLTLFGSKAPGIAWIGQFFVPLGQLMGDIDDGLMLSVLLVQSATLLLCVRMARSYFPEGSRRMWVGPLFAAAAPLFIGLSQQFWVEPLQALAAAYFFWTAIESRTGNPAITLARLVFVSGVALLAKSTTPLYCLVPGMIAVANVWRERRSKCFEWRDWPWTLWLHFCVSITVLILALAWYWVNMREIFAFMHFASSGDASVYYGIQRAWHSKMVYWGNALKLSFVTPETGWYILVSMICAGGMFVRAMFSRSASPDDYGRDHLLVTVGAGLQVLLVLSVFSLNINEDARFLFPLIPAVVVLVVALVRLLPKSIGYGLVIVLFVQLIYVHSQAFGWCVKDSRISPYVNQAERDTTLDAELKRLDKMVCNDNSGVPVVGVDLRWLNNLTLSYYSSKEGLNRGSAQYYMSAGWAEKSIKSAIARLHGLRPSWFISVDNREGSSIPADSFNIISSPLLNSVKFDPEYEKRKFENMHGIVVYRRVIMREVVE